MTLTVSLSKEGTELTAEAEQRIERMLKQLERRLAHFPEPKALARLKQQVTQRQITVDLRVELGSHAGELISHQSAGTADHAVRLAVEDIERQLERRLSSQRGEQTYGVPSRRLPKSLRPHPLHASEERVEQVPAEVEKT